MVEQYSRGYGVPRADVERVMQHYGVSMEEAERMISLQGVENLLPPRGARLGFQSSSLPEEPWAKWTSILDNLIFQAYYRVLSFVSIHAPVPEVFEAAKYIAETKRGGNVYWVVEPRIAKWENLDVNPPHGMKMTVWLFGSHVRGKNTVIVRRGWWSFYLFDVQVKRLARTFGTYMD